MFVAETHANAEFVRNTNLPMTERTAASLSRVLGFQVGFSKALPWELMAGAISGGLGGEAPAGYRIGSVGTPIRNNGMEAIAWPVNDDTRMWFVRKADPGFSVLLHPRTIAVLAGFWILAFGLAWVLARGIVTPLRQLASRLPNIENDPEATLPGAERRDEIGQVARAYLDARSTCGRA